MGEGGASAGFIRSYGMFWHRSEVDWSPGAGNGGKFRLLGRIGQNRGTIQVCDFRTQRGIYVLYDDHGAYYVGLAKERDLGLRLRDHTLDGHRQRWDRFSWFGFRRVLAGQLTDGTQRLGIMPERLLTNSQRTIRDIEALLIEALGTYRTGNRQQMKFASAECWYQVPRHDQDHYLDKLT